MSSTDDKREGVTLEEGKKGKSQADIVKEQEAKLRAKYPGLKAQGSSTFLQKRLSSKGPKYFDSGDYNMAKADGSKKKPLPSADKLLIGSRGDAIPTPENMPPRKPSLIQSKLAAGLS